MDVPRKRRRFDEKNMGRPTADLASGEIDELRDEVERLRRVEMELRRKVGELKRREKTLFATVDRLRKQSPP